MWQCLWEQARLQFLVDIRNQHILHLLWQDQAFSHCSAQSAPCLEHKAQLDTHKKRKKSQNVNNSTVPMNMSCPSHPYQLTRFSLTLYPQLRTEVSTDHPSVILFWLIILPVKHCNLITNSSAFDYRFFLWLSSLYQTALSDDFSPY